MSERPARRDSVRNRERLVVAAREVFAERGFGATLDDIARYAGLGTGTAYRHFPNKHAIAAEVLRDATEQIVVDAEEALKKSKAHDVIFGAQERRVPLGGNDPVESPSGVIEGTAVPGRPSRAAGVIEGTAVPNRPAVEGAARPERVAREEPAAGRPALGRRTGPGVAGRPDRPALPAGDDRSGDKPDDKPGDGKAGD